MGESWPREELSRRLSVDSPAIGTGVQCGPLIADRSTSGGSSGGRDRHRAARWGRTVRRASSQARGPGTGDRRAAGTDSRTRGGRAGGRPRVGERATGSCRSTPGREPCRASPTRRSWRRRRRVRRGRGRPVGVGIPGCRGGSLVVGHLLVVGPVARLVDGNHAARPGDEGFDDPLHLVGLESLRGSLDNIGLLEVTVGQLSILSRRAYAWKRSRFP